MPPGLQPGHKRNKAPGCPHPHPAPQPSRERTGNSKMLPKGGKVASSLVRTPTVAKGEAGKKCLILLIG